MSKFTTEDQIETYNLDLLDALGYGYTHGATLAPDALTPTPSPRGRGSERRGREMAAMTCARALRTARNW